eukprot:1145909-Pelagomonas_calceolata.AAC.7
MRGLKGVLYEVGNLHAPIVFFHDEGDPRHRCRGDVNWAPAPCTHTLLSSCTPVQRGRCANPFHTNHCATHTPEQQHPCLHELLRELFACTQAPAPRTHLSSNTFLHTGCCAYLCQTGHCVTNTPEQ